jgi:hypothetical protein
VLSKSDRFAVGVVVAFSSRLRIYILLVSTECGDHEGLHEILRVVEDPVVQCVCVCVCVCVNVSRPRPTPNQHSRPRKVQGGVTRNGEGSVSRGAEGGTRSSSFPSIHSETMLRLGGGIRNDIVYEGFTHNAR